MPRLIPLCLVALAVAAAIVLYLVLPRGSGEPPAEALGGAALDRPVRRALVEDLGDRVELGPSRVEGALPDAEGALVPDADEGVHSDVAAGDELSDDPIRIPVILRDSSGNGLIDAIRALGPRNSLGLPTVVALRERPGERLAGSPPRMEEDSEIGRLVSARDGKAPLDVAVQRGFLGVLEFDEVPAHASVVVGEEVLDTLPVNGNEKQLVFTLELERVVGRHGTLRFRVAGPDGLAPANTAWLLSPLHRQPGFSPTRLEEGASALIEGLPPERFRLQITALRLAPFDALVRIPPGGVVDLGVIELVEPALLKGRVLMDGRPVRLKRIGARRPGEMHSLHGGGGGGTTHMGSFLFANIPPGEIILSGRVEGGAILPTRIQVEPGRNAELVLQAERGREVRLVPGFARNRSSLVVVRDAAGDVCWSGSWRTANPGFFEREIPPIVLVPGAYTCVSHDPGRAVRRAPFVVPDGTDVFDPELVWSEIAGADR